MSVLTLEAKLERAETNTPWGFRMQGGKDFSSPLTIQKVNPGSLAAKCGLQVGDIILKIGNLGAEILRHKEAQDTIVASGNRLDLLLQRGGSTPSYETFSTPQTNSFTPKITPVKTSSQPNANFNTSAKPFGAPSAPSAPSYGGPGVNNLTNRTQQLSMEPDYKAAAQKYSDFNDPPVSNQHQSSSFRQLQNMIDSGQESEPIPPWRSPASAPAPFNPPAAPKAPTWTPKPAPVAAPQPKQWTPSAPPPALAPRMPPPSKPSGVNAIRGRRGDASMQNQGSVSGIPKTALCASCGNTIRGPFVLAMGKSWCPEHFVCANPRCGCKLIDVGFVEEGGHLYCEQDYAQHFAPKCHKCTRAIVGECVNALSQQWHPECFLCAQCHQPIGGTQFHIEEGKPYCEKDWGAMFQTMCAGCEFPIEPGDRWVEAMSKNFHSECFYCMTCQISLEGQPFYCKGGKPFCKKHAR